VHLIVVRSFAVRSVIHMHDKAILVVGSDLRLRGEVRNCLRRIGLHAIAVAVGDDVPARLAQIRFDGVVLDIDPHRDDYAKFVLSIRRTDPQCKIMVVSDPLGTPIRRNLRVLGVRHIIRKPVNVYRLYQAVVAMLQVRDTPLCGVPSWWRRGEAIGGVG
jgi:DNA-binding NarL/FixJ family response regulator